MITIKQGSTVYKKDDNNYYVDIGNGPGTYHAYDGEPENMQSVLDYVSKNPGKLQAYAQPDYTEIERVRAVKSRLDEIDKLSIRAIRAKSVGKDNQSDRNKLAELDAEAELLRGQL